MLMRVDAHDSKAILSRRALLLASLAVGGCTREIMSQRVDPALAPLIPPDTTTLAGIRMDNLRDTPSWDKFFPQGGSIALENLRRQTGLDIGKGTYEVVYCLGGRHNAALIRGKFVDGGIANSGLEPQLRLEGAQKFPYKGFTFIGREEQAVTFFNSSVAVAGRAAALRAIIDNRELRNATPTALLNLVAKLPPEAHFYLVTIAPKLPEEGIAGLKSLPLSLNSARIWADLRSTSAAVRAEAEAASPEDAKKLLDGLRAAQSLLRMTLKGDQKDLLERVQFFSQGTIVKLQADLPLEIILENIKSLDLLG